MGFIDREAKVFLALVAGGIRRMASLETLKKRMEEKGAVEEVTIGEKGYKGVMFGKTAFIAQREKVVFGAFGTFEDKELKALVAAVDRKIKPYKPKEYSDLKKKKRKEKDATDYIGQKF